MRTALLAAMLPVGLVLAAGTAMAANEGPMKEGFLAIQDGRFFKDGRPFPVRANDCDPAVGHWFKFHGPWLETGIQECKQYGFNAIRAWVPGTVDGEQAATYGRWKEDREAFYREFDDSILKRCKDQGIYLILTLTELPPDAAPGDHYDVTSPAYAAFRVFFQDFCSHYKDETGILFYEVANEYQGPGKARPDVRRFYEQAAADVRAADPNHLISSGLDCMLWDGQDMWRFINSSRGIDIASTHVYAHDDWSFNWHTEREFTRIVREQAEAARQVGKPLFLGEFGTTPRMKAGGENPELIWFMKAAIREGVPAYGFHWFYPVPEDGMFRLIPEHSPQTAEWMRGLNALVAEGKKVPEDFGPKTTDYALPLCNGARPFSGGAPITRGNVKVETDEAVFGQAAPSLRISWQAGGATVEMGPYHPNDLTEYREAGGVLRLAVRTDGEVERFVQVLVRDGAGKTASLPVVAFETTARQQGGPPVWTTVRLPMQQLDIDWSQWIAVGFEFSPDSAGTVNVDDIEVACEHAG
jgi:hypothetical protein